MPTTTNMSLVLPTEGGSADVWDTLLNAALTLVDSHDHTTGRGVQVPSAALKINADVSWSFSGTNYAITDAKAIDFTPVAAASISGYSSALFANSSDSNNLYYRNSSGTNVKITDGSTLNISITGGIGGDYASIGALLDYDDATDTYRFRQQTSASVRQFAKISAADVQLFEYFAAGASPVPTNSVKLKSPAALAASYSVTFPDAVPGAAAFVQASTTGVLSFSNTIAQAVTATEFKHSTVLVHQIPPSAWVDPNASHTMSAGGTSNFFYRWLLAASANTIGAPICLPSGSRITSYSVYISKNTDNTNTIACQLFRASTTGGTIGNETPLGSGDLWAGNATGARTMGESGLSIDMSDGNEYYLVVTPGGGATPAGDHVYSALIGYTRP